MADVTGKRVVYYGDVQGVGFRKRAELVARAFPVTGYVRNLPDGSVELVAEGAAAAVAAFLRKIDETLRREIARAETGDVAPSRFPAFTIRRD